MTRSLQSIQHPLDTRAFVRRDLPRVTLSEEQFEASVPKAPNHGMVSSIALHCNASHYEIKGNR
jgi:hypothetical protein